MSAKKAYMALDGRALTDVNRAAVLEYLGEYAAEGTAIRAIKNSWGDVDAVLVSYEYDDENKLATGDGTVIGHVDVL